MFVCLYAAVSSAYTAGPLELTTKIVCGYDVVPSCTHVEFKKLIKICNTGETTVTGIIFKDTLPHEVVNSPTGPIIEPVFDFPTGVRITKGTVKVEPAPADKPDKGSTKVTWYQSGLWPDNLVGYYLAPDECATMYLWLDTRDKPNNPNCPYYWSSPGPKYLDSSLNIEWRDENGAKQTAEFGNDEFTKITVVDDAPYPSDFTCGCQGLGSPTLSFVTKPHITSATPLTGGGNMYTIEFTYSSMHPNHFPPQHIEYLDNFVYVRKDNGAWQPAMLPSLGELPGIYTKTFQTNLQPPFDVLDIKVDECMGMATADPETGSIPPPYEQYPNEDFPNVAFGEVTQQNIPEFSTISIILVLVVIAALYPMMKTRIGKKKK